MLRSGGAQPYPVRLRPPTTRRRPQPSSQSASRISWGAEMQPYLRLRQICLAAPHLEASSALIRALLGVEECHRDSGVAKYGLENALFPIGPDRFLEVVCPIRPGTAAGRFLTQTQGRGGYMLIFDCDDPKARAERAKGAWRAPCQPHRPRTLPGLSTASEGLPRELFSSSTIRWMARTYAATTGPRVNIGSTMFGRT